MKLKYLRFILGIKIVLDYIIINIIQINGTVTYTKENISRCKEVVYFSKSLSNRIHETTN